jgi:uncharacterized MAPEG superfamily protein
MTPAAYALLGFAAWTLFMLAGTVGIYRWSRVLSGRASVAEWRADEPQGSEWYRRAMRAHANCVENLPVFGAVVLLALVTGLHDPRFEALAVTVLVARVLQTSVHVGLVQTNCVASVRFAFFLVQVLAMLAMMAILA